MHSFDVHSNESACRKKVRLGLEQVVDGIGKLGLLSVNPSVVDTIVVSMI